ncbi:MAG: alpha/beta hydrolase family protein [bacterium]|nr:alpha/beta hydrolase family protein [bacterium]
MLFIPNLLNGLDHLVSGFSTRDKLYRQGLGDLEFLRTIPDRHPRDVAAAKIEWDDEIVAERSGATRQQGTFRSPAADWLPEESRTAQIEMIRPANCNSDTPVFVHFAATGDETFLPRRFLLANALADEGIASILLMNPYYGPRRPKTQSNFSVPTVSDQMRMNGASIFEGVALVRWAEAEGYTRVGVTGVSMGGSMAATVAAMIETPLRAAVCIGPVGPAPAFTQGALTGQVDWQALAKDYGLPYGADPESLQPVKDALNETMGVVDLRGSAPPVRPDWAILVGASHDGYVPADSVTALHEHWPGSEMRWISAGHVTAVMLHAGDFRQAVIDAARR